MDPKQSQDPGHRSPYSKDEKNRHYCFVMGTIVRACDELYQLCLSDYDQLLCQDISSLLQNIAYDFVTLDEWLKLKNKCKELPLPERKNSTSSLVGADFLEKNKHILEESAVSSNGIDAKLPTDPHNSSSTTEKLPDVSPFENQNLQNSWMLRSHLASENDRSFQNLIGAILERNSRHIPYQVDSSQNRNSSMPIINSNFLGSHSENVVSSNVCPIPHHQYQQQFSTHYMPHLSHYHMPYSIYSSNSGLSNVIPMASVPNGSQLFMRPPYRSHRRRNRRFSSYTDQYNKSSKSFPKNGMQNGYCNGDDTKENCLIPENSTIEKNHECPPENHNGLIDKYSNYSMDVFPSKDTVPDSEPRTLSPFSHSTGNDTFKVFGENDVKTMNSHDSNNDEIENHDGEVDQNMIIGSKPTNCSVVLEPLTEPKEEQEEDGILISSQFDVQQEITSENIFGLAEDESLLHFPKLSSGNQKKGKRQVATSLQLKLSEVAFPNEIGSGQQYSSSVNNTFTDFTLKENIEEKGASFSEVIKTQRNSMDMPITKQPLSFFASDSTDDKIINKKNLSIINDAPAKKDLYTKQEQCFDKLDENGENTDDSEGWEVVKGRSKWRESSELRFSRNQKYKKFAQQKDRRNITCDDSIKVQDSFSNSFGNVDESHGKYDCLEVKEKRGNQQKQSLPRSKYSNRHDLSQSNVPFFDMPTISNSDIELQFRQICNDDSERSNLVFSEEDYLECEDLKKKYFSGLSEMLHALDGDSTEQTSESCPVLVEEDLTTIDPNEMYSAYIKYLSNVEEEQEDSESKNTEQVLHPEILSGYLEYSENNHNAASLEQMTDFVNRDPIRALDFMKKLDNKIKHQEDMKKKNEVKHKLAHEKRLQFLQCKTAKLRGLTQKVEEVKAAQQELALQRKSKLDLKLKRAEEKRKMHLNIIKRKAHDEEEKLKEIAFINELEAQNRRHDSLALRQEHEERLQSLVEERQRRLEEKAAKEAAVEERRKALEAERQEKLEMMKEKRRKKEEIIDRKQQEKEQVRLVIAREKAREREERLQARHSAQQATLEELQKKIQQKQEDSARRHIECIELIRQKAVEIGLHRNSSEGVPSYLKLYKTDARPNYDNDKYKLYLKKRLKKIKSRMTMRGSNYIEVTHSGQKELTVREASLQRVLNRLKSYEPHKIYMWQDDDCSHVDRYLDELLLFLQEDNQLRFALKDMKAFLYLESVIHTFNYANNERMCVPILRCMIKIITLCDLSCLESVEMCLYFLLSNILATTLDTLRFSLQALERACKSWGLIVELLLRFHAIVIDGLNALPQSQLLTIPDFAPRMRDLISYILCSGLVNKLIDLFKPSLVDDQFMYSSLVVPSILFLKRLLSPWFICDDLTDTLKKTELFTTVPLLYEGLMKHISNDDDTLPENCMPIISLFIKLAEVDLKLFQEILGAENIALQWRGIASCLMTYCTTKSKFDTLLNCVIKLVGYFAIHNVDNQTLLQSGKQPTVLQQLVRLPFQYFCDPDYVKELFPTLISCSFNNVTNRAIVEKEISYSALEKFMNSPEGRESKIIQLLLCLKDEDSDESSKSCNLNELD